MRPITIAVLSDLHVGEGARAKDLCPDNIKGKGVDTGYKKTFFDFLHRKSMEADYLVLPGDVSHFANPSEFDLASKFVSDTMKKLRVRRDRVIFVPGNHDVDWSVLKSIDPTGFRHKQRYAPLRNRDWIFSEIMGRGKPDVLEPPHFCLWRLDDVLAVGYNSSWHDDPKEAVHHGVISDEHLVQLSEQLAVVDSASHHLRLFLVHHHPVQYSDPIDTLPDFSAMTNAGKLLTLLQKHKFDLLIHGHKHMPNFETHIVNSSYPLAILCAGSFSVQLDSRWSGLVHNQFHLVHVEGRDAELANIYGRVESWAYVCGSGWVPSKSVHGISHSEPFGTYLLPAQLKKVLQPILASKLKKRDYVEWSEVVREMAQLKYLPPERAVEVIDSLSAEMGFRRHGDPPDDIVLLKDKGRGRM